MTILCTALDKGLCDMTMECWLVLLCRHVHMFNANQLTSNLAATQTEAKEDRPI